MFRKGDEPIPGYRLEKFLGKGQFGEVWKTTAPGGTAAALKFIDLGGKQGIKEFRGVRRVKEIRHANLMPITALWMLDGEGNILGDKALDTYDPEARSAQATLQVDDSDGVRPEWLVVAMLLGLKNLADRLEECRAAGEPGIPVDELLRYMEEAAKGIDYLNGAHHDMGNGCVAVQHCDIKPANIMLIGDAAVVCDFGLARVLSDAAATATGMVGSPAYMAPECIGRKPGPASDQYSLAVSYVELRTGHLPFKEITYLAVLEANRNGNLDLSRLSPAEQQVIRKATSVKPDDRYASSLDMVRALRRAVEGTSSGLAFPAWGWAATAVVILLALPALAWLGITTLNGRNGAKEDDTRASTIVFIPEDVEVKVNGTQQAIQNGKFSLTLRPGERVSLEATHPDGYAPLRRQLTWDLLSSPEMQLQLERNAQWHAAHAAELLASGDAVAALEAYKSAIRLDPKLESPTPLVLTKHTNTVRRLAAIAPAQFASMADDGLICVWNLPAGNAAPSARTLEGLIEGQLTESISASGDGRWLVAGGQDDRVVAWDLKSPKEPPIALLGHSEDVTVVRVLPDSQSILSASFDKTLRWWRFADGKVGEPTILKAHEAEVLDCHISPNGRWVVSLSSDNKLIRWDLQASDPATSAKPLPVVESRVRVLAISPDSNWLVLGCEDRKVGMIRLETLDAPKFVDAAKDSIESMVFEPSGQRLYIGDSLGEVRSWQVSEGSLVKPFDVFHHAAPVISLAVSPDGQYAASGSWDKIVAFWRLDSEGKHAPLSLVSEHGQIHQVTFSADGKWLIAACDDGSILVWNVALCDLIQRAVEKKGSSSKTAVEA